MKGRQLQVKDFVWALGSCCALASKPFDAQLLLKQHPPPCTLAALITAARAFGFDTVLAEANAAGLASVTHTVVMLMRADGGEATTDAAETDDPAAADETAVIEIIDMSRVTGDGRRSVADLALQALGPVAAAGALPVQWLAPQGAVLTTALQPGQQVQLEYRYISPFNLANRQDCNAREAIRGSALERELLHAGRFCQPSIPAPLQPHTAFSIDAVVDAQERLWLLEANCTPQLHPAVYAPMLGALFPPPPPQSSTKA